MTEAGIPFTEKEPSPQETEIFTEEVLPDLLDIDEDFDFVKHKLQDLHAMEASERVADATSVKIKTLPEKALVFLQEFEETMTFYESNFTLGVFTMDGELLWRSRIGSEDAMAHILTCKDSINSFFASNLSQRMKKIHTWTIEFRNSSLFFYFVNSHFYILMIVHSTKKIGILQQKLSLAQIELQSLLI